MAETEKELGVFDLSDDIKSFATAVCDIKDPVGVRGVFALEMIVRIKQVLETIDKLKSVFMREANKAYQDLTTLNPAEKVFNILGAKVTQFTKAATWTYPRTPEFIKLEGEAALAIAKLKSAQIAAQKDQSAKRQDTVNKDTDQLFKISLSITPA